MTDDGAEDSDDGSGTYDLDRLFDGGLDDSPRAALDLFVNREPEIAAFREAYDGVHRAPQTLEATDLRSPRRNVLVFFGMGGIGKSWLSRRCQSTLEKTDGVLMARLDLRDGSFLDPEIFVLSLRGAIATAGDISPRAFDIGLAAYWSTKHPGENMPEFIRNSRGLRRLAGNTELHDQLAETVDSLLGIITVAGATLKLGRKLVKALSTHLETKRLLASCPRLPEMLSSEDPNLLRLYLPYLLSWDLDRQAQRARTELTVFIDNFEDAEQVSRSRGDIEDAISRAAYLMPNALFVITGRNRLSWADGAAAGRLLFFGSERWPELADNRSGRLSRQYLLGSLSSGDARKYLDQRLGGLTEESAVGALVNAADGWPLFLDIIATRVEQLRASGRPVEAREFTSGFVEAVVRVMRDMDDDSRDLLRASSLLPMADGESLIAALPGIRLSSVRRFLSSSLLGRSGDERRMNQALRESIWRADAELSDGWGDTQWSAVTERVLEYLRERAHTTPGSDLAFVWFNALYLSARFSKMPSWIAALADDLFARGSWEVLRGAAHIPGIADSPLAPFAVAAAAAAQRATGDTRGAMSRLASVTGAPLHGLSPELRDYVHWQAAASAERVGDWEAAANACTLIETPSVSTRALVRRGRLAWIGDNLVAAEQAARFVMNDVPSQPNADDHATALAITARSLAGWVLFTRGQMGRARRMFEDALVVAERSEDDFYISSELSHIAMAAAFEDAPDADRVVSEAVRTAERVGATRQLAQARTAALLAARRTDPDQRLQGLQRIVLDLEHSGDLLEGRLPLLAMTVTAGRTHRSPLAAELVSRLDTLTQRHRGHQALSIAAAWATGLTPRLPSRVIWGDPEREVQARWELIGARRAT